MTSPTDLEKLALLATRRGPWEAHNLQTHLGVENENIADWAVMDDRGRIATMVSPKRPDNARFIAACDPTTILQLLADRRELVAAVRELLTACPPLDVDRGDNGRDDQLSCEAWDAIAKLQALAASMGET